MIDATSEIDFTDNYEDLSDETGFQFRFYCGRCDQDYLSDPEPCAHQEESEFLTIVGKIFTHTADRGGELTCDEEGIQHDVALRSAIAEVREHFHQCHSCGEWICDVCWNQDFGLCQKCAPSRMRRHAGG